MLLNAKPICRREALNSGKREALIIGIDTPRVLKINGQFVKVYFKEKFKLLTWAIGSFMASKYFEMKTKKDFHKRI